MALSSLYATDETYTPPISTVKCSKKFSEIYKLNVVPTDLSIYPWGSKKFYENTYQANNKEEPYTTAKTGTTSTINFPMGALISYYSASCRIAYDMKNWDANANNYRFVTEYDYKDVVACIYVSISPTNDSLRVIDTYYDDYVTNYSNYVVRSIYLVPFMKHNYSDSYRTQSSNSFTFVGQFNINGSYEDDNSQKNFDWVKIAGDASTLFGVRRLMTKVVIPAASKDKIPREPDSVTLCNYDTVSFVKSDDYNKYFSCVIENVTKEQVMEQAARCGFCFCTNDKDAANKKYGDKGFYVPIIGDDGITTGKYTDGADANTLPQATWTTPTAQWDNSKYDPTKPIDPNNYTDKIELNKPALTTTGIFNRTFGMNAINIKSLADFLWNADETIFNEIIKGLSLMGGNPIDGLIDLRLYPFDVVSKTSGGASKSIVVGRTDTKVNGIEINDYNAILNLGSCTFFPNFGNFLDYEPFTTASLYIPYVGIVPISTADFMGQTISCKMVVDITTGSCTAIVFANDIPIIYKNGNIGVEIPMTGTNSAEYASRIAGCLTSGASDIALGASSKSVGQVVSGVGSIADSALSVNNTMYNTAGSSSPACGLWQPQNCYFIIQRPVPIVPENYGHTVGYSCNYQAKISECSGYTQTYNVDVSSINAPESEKNAIAEILNSGFYA